MALSGSSSAGRVGLASLVLVLAFATSAVAQQWVEVKDRAFAVAMPGPPERSAQEVTVNGTGEVVDQVELSVTVGAVEYFLSHTLFRKMPADLSPAKCFSTAGTVGRAIFSPIAPSPSRGCRPASTFTRRMAGSSCRASSMPATRFIS